MKTRILYLLIFTVMAASVTTTPTYAARKRAKTKVGRWFQDNFKIKDLKRKRTKTEAGVPKGCTTSSCSRNALKNDPIRKIPRSDIGKGALRVLTTLYGTCDAKKPLRKIRYKTKLRTNAYEKLDVSKNRNAEKSDNEVYIKGYSKKKPYSVREVSNSKNFLAGGPYGKALQTGSGMCPNRKGVVNAAKTPKVFGYGAAGRMHKGKYNLFRCGDPSYLKRLSDLDRMYKCGLSPDSQPAIALDCAEFVGASVIASCKKLHKDQKVTKNGLYIGKDRKTGDERQMSTEHMVSVGKEKSGRSCLTNSPKISEGSSIQPGNIFAGSKAHSIMITRVGPDPLGIAKARKRKGGCKSLNFYDFNFDLAHSPSFDALGPINSSAKQYGHLVYGIGRINPYPLNKIAAMARVLCLRKSRGPAQSFINDSKFSLLRHKSGDPECSYKKGKCPKITGDECADHCGV